MDKKLRKGLRTWIEIDKKAIKHNYSVFRSLIPKNTKLLAVVKSNAYGHSLIDFSKEIVKNGVDFLGVDSIVEGLALRREGIKTPILVLGYTLPELFNDA
ncbi:MAG: alanine racemase, partial [Candidatus Paceibacterota bacterium]